MKPLYLLIVTYLVPVCLFGSHQPIFHLTNGHSSAEVPFTLVENLIIVQAFIAGKKPLNLILDNGTQNLVIFKAEYIENLSLPLGPRITFRGAGAGDAVKATVISEVPLDLLGVATDRLGIVVLDNNPFEHLNLGDREVHGVLGSTIFQSFVVEIDYPNCLLRFHQHDSFQPPLSFQPLSMKVIEGRAYLSALVRGKKVSVEAYLMLDLGFNNALMLQMTDSLARKILTRRAVANIGVGFSGAISGRLGRIDLVQIGSKKIMQVHTIAPFIRSYPPVYISPGIQRQGSVGNALFLDTSIILNYPDETFYIQGTTPNVAEQKVTVPLPPKLAIEKSSNNIHE